ncbi:MAG: alpha/beta hydrolase [Corynebacterium sp.]|nr:alpha/beta hydrolase [Corynebacterium sp.]
MNTTLNWEPDFLGPDFTRLSLPLGADPDGEGTVAATLVRYAPTDIAGRPALLWVHGMTDYFFQAHVAEYFHAKGFAFYALDLRKCGRSRMEGQRWHYVSDLSFYYQDLDAAVEVLRRFHPTVVPLAHSTAGIIVPLWLDYRRRHNELAPIKALILNSPWLDMMGISPRVVSILRPIVDVVGKHFPMLPFPGGGLSAAGQSIHKDFHGEWDYDLAFKPLPGHKKYIGWLRTILHSQALIHDNKIDVGIPTLVLCSTSSHFNKPYSEQTNVSDAVIDVKQTQRWAPQLGRHVTVRPISDARHDVFLSRSHARDEAFRISTEFLRATV